MKYFFLFLKNIFFMIINDEIIQYYEKHKTILFSLFNMKVI